MKTQTKICLTAILATALMAQSAFADSGFANSGFDAAAAAPPPVQSGSAVQSSSAFGTPQGVFINPTGSGSYSYDPTQPNTPPATQPATGRPNYYTPPKDGCTRAWEAVERCAKDSQREDCGYRYGLYFVQGTGWIDSYFHVAPNSFKLSAVEHCMNKPIPAVNDSMLRNPCIQEQRQRDEACRMPGVLGNDYRF